MNLDDEQMRRLQADMSDDFDEELELELDERMRHEDYMRHPVPEEIIVPEVY